MPRTRAGGGGEGRKPPRGQVESVPTVKCRGTCSSVVELSTADRRVAGSIPAASSLTFFLRERPTLLVTVTNFRTTKEDLCRGVLLWAGVIAGAGTEQLRPRRHVASGAAASENDVSLTGSVTHHDIGRCRHHRRDGLAAGGHAAIHMTCLNAMHQAIRRGLECHRHGGRTQG